MKKIITQRNTEKSLRKKFDDRVQHIILASLVLTEELYIRKHNEMCVNCALG
jgi:hypothetical protein